MKLNRAWRVVGIACALLLVLTASGNAQGLQNGGFESGTLAPGWGSTGEATVTASAIGGFLPAEGTYQASLTTGPGTVSQATLETFLGLNSGTLNSLNGTSGQRGGSGIAQTFNVQAGDVISFQYNFLPNGNTASSDENDSAFFTLHLASSSSSSFTTLATTLSSGGSATGYQTITTGPLSAGTYLLGFGVYDISAFGNSQNPTLLIDNVQQIAVPEPSSVALLAAAGLSVLLFRRRRKS